MASIPDSPPPPSQQDYASHAQKTASDPRADDEHVAAITHISTPTKSVRLIDFQTRRTPFTFKAGQWVDLFTPNSPDQPGGFSIVSAPSAGQSGHFRLAIQHAQRNPPAAFLWQPANDLIGKQDVRIRVGGQFTFPPVNFRKLGGKVRRVTLIAGGIGSNPMLSILGAIRDSRAPLQVCMLYGIKSAAEAVFLDELHEYCRDSSSSSSSSNSKEESGGIGLDLRLFVSQSAETQGLPGTVHQRRFDARDLDETIGTQNEQGEAAAAAAGGEAEIGIDGNLYYICGPAQMTDFVQEYLLKKGVPQELVQTERWW